MALRSRPPRGLHSAAAAAVLLAAVGTSMSAGAFPVDCAAAERTLFACAIGVRRVAVCASTPLTPDAGSIQYRFGRAQGAQIAYPPAGTDWRAVTRGGTLMVSGGGGAWLGFTNRDYRYVVYTAIGRGWGSRAGVVVEHRGRRLASLACTGPVTSAIGPDLFVEAGIAADDAGFELPDR